MTVFGQENFTSDASGQTLKVRIKLFIKLAVIYKEKYSTSDA